MILSLSFCRYREAFNDLKSMKTEIEHLQHLLEKSKLQMQKDFELWWAESAGKQNLENCVSSVWLVSIIYIYIYITIS